MTIVLILSFLLVAVSILELIALHQKKLAKPPDLIPKVKSDQACDSSAEPCPKDQNKS